MITLFDNYNYNLDEYYESYKEYCIDNDITNIGDIDSNEFYSWLNETFNIEFDDLLMNLKYDKENNVDCVVTGKVGRWNGNFEIECKHFNTLKDAIFACIENCEYYIITEDNGIINIISIHHDGRNNFDIHKLNKKGYDAPYNTNLNNEKYWDKFSF